MLFESYLWKFRSMASLVGSKMYNHVCIGGTFDGIHQGHKLLLGEAVRLSKKRLVVGVTDGPMIRGKVLFELIAPIEERTQKVRDYLQSINPNLHYQIEPIIDPYGPAVTDQDLESIVVSQETIRGAEKINYVRSEKGWKTLQVHVVDILPEINLDRDIMTRLKEEKISSSLMRVQKLGTILRPPLPNNNLPKRPYLIGLTGGVASGKTTIADYLKTFGFGVINYDLLGHKTYENVGSKTYNQIVQYFGEEILEPDTKKIDRRKLGAIVFSDRSKLDKLNAIVWPAIYELVDSEIQSMKDKHDVIVLESALLIESKQTARVHQVWTTIVPPEEAISRQMKTRNLSREESEKRVNAQIDNLTRVQQSNVVFCSSWEPEFTQQQVLKCLQELREKYLNTKS